MSLQRVSIIPVKEFNSVYSPGKIKGFTSTQIKQAFQQRVHQQHPLSRCIRGRSFLELSLECNCSQLHPCWNSHFRERLLPISPNCQPGKIKVTIIGNSWLSISRPWRKFMNGKGSCCVIYLALFNAYSLFPRNHSEFALMVFSECKNVKTYLQQLDVIFQTVSFH